VIAARVVVLTEAELAALVRDAVADALAAHESSAEARSKALPPRVLLDRSELAHAIGVSTRTLDRLRREGLPELTVGDVPRWRLEAVLAWLEARKPALEASAQASDPAEKQGESSATEANSCDGVSATSRKPSKSLAQERARNGVPR
jgi:hypothetical protein